MPKHEQKTCPRCQSEFECKTGTIEQCQCQTVELTDAHLDYIQARYDDCLCAACLEALGMECDGLDADPRVPPLPLRRFETSS